MPVGLLASKLARLGRRHRPAILLAGNLDTILYFTGNRGTDLSHGGLQCQVGSVAHFRHAILSTNNQMLIFTP